jgi:hypothetical protein
MSSEALVIRESWIRRVAAATVLSFRAQWIFFVIPLVYLASNAIVLSQLDSYGRMPVLKLVISLLTFSLPVGLIVLMLMRLLQYALIEKPVSPVRALGGELSDLIRHPARIINGVPILVAMILFNKAMVELKPAIPKVNPFSWDVTFMELDRLLHFGVDPWVLLQPVMGYDIVSFLANIAYNFWFVALFGAWCWFGFRARASEIRTRFFLAYMLIWFLGGGVLALIFSSAGPVYYDELGLAPNPYVGLFAYLHDVDSRLPLWFLKTQQMLWDGYTGKGPAFGISAFPSMHNASATLFALAFWRVSRPVGLFFAAYAGVVLLGSVHTGWHYAVDGYAGIALAAACWWVCGPVARWYMGLVATRRYNEGLAQL